VRGYDLRMRHDEIGVVGHGGGGRDHHIVGGGDIHRIQRGHGIDRVDG